MAGRPLPPPARLAQLVAGLLPAEAEAYLVGGAVRDALAERPAGDVDIAVRGDASRVAAALAEALGAGVFAYSERFSTYRVVAGNEHVDVAPLRGATIADDLRARDFTVNAMALDVRGAWAGQAGDADAAVGAAVATRTAPSAAIDPLGGAADLAAGRLRLCAPAALTTDPVRVLRLARFACGLGLVPEPGVMEAARAAAGGLLAVSGERIECELSALLALPQRVAAVRLLDECGGLAAVLPELGALKGVTQNRYHHHDVFEHTLEALEHLPGIVAQLDAATWLTPPADLDMPGMAPLVPLAYAVLLHDLGKPAARRIDAEGRVIFWYHDQIGARLAAEVCRRLKTSRRFEQYVARLVSRHLRLGFLVREQPLTQRAVARFRRDVEPYVIEAIVLSLADRMATRGEKTTPASVARHFRLARGVWGAVSKAPASPLLGGADVLRVLGVAPGPIVGEALLAVRDEAEAGALRDKDAAEAWLRVWWAQRQTEEAGRDA